jgi:hypothetical protein
LTEFYDEDLVFARHDRVRGKVLVIGVGTVGSSAAMHLARLGISLLLIDKDRMELPNIVRQQSGVRDLGRPKSDLADDIRQRMPWVDVEGVHANFMQLPSHVLGRYLDWADVVLAATDEAPVQRFISRACIRARKRVVFPGVWIGPQAGEAEAGEILWVDPRRRMPCYECVTTFRQGEAQNAQAGRGAQADIDSIVLAAVDVVRGLLQPGTIYAEMLHEHENFMLVHGFMPATREVGQVFNGRSLLYVQVPFPPRECPGCHRQAAPGPFGPPRRTAARAPAAVAEWRRWDDRQRLIIGIVIAGFICLVLLIAVIAAVHHTAQPASASSGALPVASGGSTSPGSQPATINPDASGSGGGSPEPSGSNPSDSGSPAPSDSGSGPQPSDSAVPSASGSGGLNPDGFALPMTAAPGNPSLTDACQQSYNDSNAAAVDVPDSSTVPSYTVQCLDGSTDLGGLNLNTYCDSLVSGMLADNPDRGGPATDAPPPWDQWECVPG